MLKLLGRLDQTLDIQDDYHRNYRIKWLVETDDVEDGPNRAMNCPGLPQVGSVWNFGNDNDAFAYCWPNWTVSQFNASSNEPNTLWVVDQPFSTKFNMTAMSSPENPLAQPPDISGTFVKYQREMQYDFEGKPIRTMSFEIRRGKEVEFDANRPTVSISINYPTLGLSTFAFMIDSVNGSPMWGLGSRMVKLSNIRWSRNIHRFGYFYTRHYDFDIDYRTFDRILPQKGWNRLKGQKPGQTLGNKNNKKHWELRTDEKDHPMTEPWFYTDSGADWDGVNEAQIAKQTIKYYPNANFFVLGVPASF
jgi:hypothetical protein